MRLCIVGETRHSRDALGTLGTLSPVVRQLLPWIERFDEVVFCGTAAPGPPPANHEPYPANRVRFLELPSGGGSSVRAKLGLTQRVLQWYPVLRRVIAAADVVHFRCPCNIGLVGLAAARGLPVRRFAMYAGNWGGFSGESPFYRLQRSWLNSPRFQGVAAVYGRWPGQPKHVITSFSPSFTEAEWRDDAASIARKLHGYLEQSQLEPLRTVSVGHLTADKNQATLLRAIALVRDRGVEVHAELLGDGPEHSRLQALSRSLGIESRIRFHGRVSLQGVRDAYRAAHVGVLASRSEGYPKVLVEAMSGGAVPVASDVGINAQMLSEGRGRLFRFGDAGGLAERLAELAAAPAALRMMALAGREYTRTRTLEAFWDLQNDILTNRLGVPARPPLSEESPN